MAELFDSYINPNNPSEVYCDLTVIRDCAEPNTRLLCSTVQIFCGSNTFCSNLIVGNGLVMCDCGDSWNCNLCGNDGPFWIPFQNGDSYTFQFQQPQTIVQPNDGWSAFGTSWSSTATFGITTCCGKDVQVGDREFKNIVINQFIGEFQTTQVGGTATISPIQQVQLDLYAIAELLISMGYDPCFYFNFCFETKGGDKECFCSEPFKLEVCADKKQSVLIESEYPSTDCFGLYYGTNFTQTWGGLPFPYSNQIRIPCAFEQTNFNITKSIIDTSQKTTASQVCENWEMNTFPIPQTFAKLLASIVAGADIMIDGVEYQTSGEIAKNNEIGSRWWTTIKFEHCECSKSLTCL
jgi:hypothetical protein